MSQYWNYNNNDNVLTITYKSVNPYNAHQVKGT